MVYTRRKSWENIAELEEDFRIDRDNVIKENKEIFKLLLKSYPSRRVRENFKKFEKEMEN